MIDYVDPSPEYRPGVCNIGAAEIRRRRASGVIGVGGAVALGALLLLVGSPPAARLLVALPLGVGFAGFLQARSGFCANYGWRGLRNLRAIGDVERVEDVEARRADRRRALSIIAASAAGAAAAAALFAILPL